MTIETHVAVPLNVAVRREDVIHFLGYPHGQEPPPRISSIIDEVIPEARMLADGRGVHERVDIGRARELGLEPLDAEALVVGIVTIGRTLERRVSLYVDRGESTRALVLDAAGSAAAEEAADRLGSIIGGEEPGPEARHVSCRISPGYGRWSLSWQRQLFDVVPHVAIGVKLLPTMLMSPRKSISFAMWLGADARPLTGLSGCATCELETCRYRRVRR